MYIHVKVHPKSKKEVFEQINEDHFEAWIKEPAEQNLANKRVFELLKNYFPEAKRVRIISGHQSPSKLFSVNFED